MSNNEKVCTVAEWYRMKRLKAESTRWLTNHRSVLLWLTVPARRDADCSKSLSSVINWPVWWRNVWRVVSLSRGDQRPVRQQNRNNGLVNLDGGHCSHLSALLRHSPISSACALWRRWRHPSNRKRNRYFRSNQRCRAEQLRFRSTPLWPVSAVRRITWPVIFPVPLPLWRRRHGAQWRHLPRSRRGRVSYDDCISVIYC